MLKSNPDTCNGPERQNTDKIVMFHSINNDKDKLNIIILSNSLWKSPENTWDVLILGFVT